LLKAAEFLIAFDKASPTKKYSKLSNYFLFLKNTCFIEKNKYNKEVKENVCFNITRLMLE